MAQSYAYFDTSHMAFNSMDYQQMVEIPRNVSHDEELLGELPTEEGRARLREFVCKQFLSWLKLAKPGARFLYHEGYLLKDREDVSIQVIALAAGHAAGFRQQYDEIEHSVRIVVQPKEALVLLFQRRVDWGKWEYWAVRTSLPYKERQS